MTKKTFSKTELALLYAPELEPRSALNRLMMWIKHNRDLYAALLATGYHTNQKLFTAAQTALIFQYLGEP